jgi:hypothetical protein
MEVYLHDWLRNNVLSYRDSIPRLQLAQIKSPTTVRTKETKGRFSNVIQ